MKLSKDKLKQIIKEEVEKLLAEEAPVVGTHPAGRGSIPYKADSTHPGLGEDDIVHRWNIGTGPPERLPREFFDATKPGALIDPEIGEDPYGGWPASGGLVSALAPAAPASGLLWAQMLAAELPAAMAVAPAAGGAAAGHIINRMLDYPAAQLVDDALAARGKQKTRTPLKREAGVRVDPLIKEKVNDN
jgi:hypothetical protein